MWTLMELFYFLLAGLVSSGVVIGGDETISPVPNAESKQSKNDFSSRIIINHQRQLFPNFQHDNERF